MEPLFISLYHYMRKHLKLVFVISMLVLMVCAASVFHLRVSENINDLIPESEHTSALQEIMSASNVVDQLLVLIGDGTQSKSQVKTLADSLTERLGKPMYDAYLHAPKLVVAEEEFAKSYDFFYNFLPFLMNDEDWEYVSSQCTADSVQQRINNHLKSLMSPSSIVSKQFILKDPLSLAARKLQSLNALRLISSLKQEKNYLYTHDETRILLVLEHKTELNDTHSNSLLLRMLKEDIESLRSFSPCPIYTYGALVATVENAQIVQRDVWLTVCISITLLSLLIAAFFKSVRSVFVMFLPCMAAVICTLALIQTIEGELSAIILGIGAVLMGIAIDYSLHLGVHFQVSQDVTQYFKGTVRPLVISCITSSGAFFLMYFLDAPALQTLGLFAGFTILFSALFSLCFLPYLLEKKKTKTQSTFFLFEALASFPFHQKKWIVSGVLVLTLISSFYVRKLSFEGDLTNLGYESAESALAREAIEDASSIGHKTVYVSSYASSLDSALILAKSLLPKLEDLKGHKQLEHYISLANLYPSSEQQVERLKQWQDFWRGEQGEKLLSDLEEQAQSKGFKAGAFKQFHAFVQQASFEYMDYEALKALRLNDQLVFQQDGLYHVVTVIKVKEEDKVHVYDVLREEPGLLVFDKTYYSAQLIQLMQDSFDDLSWWSLLFILFFLCIAYGRLELAIINLIPVAMSWLITLGTMAALGLKINIFNLIISTVIFGLGIDYSVFMMHGMLQARLGLGELKHFKYSILLSACTTLIGIGCLALARHPALQSIAYAAIIGIVSVLICTFCVQIPLYRFLFYSGGKLRETPLKWTDLLLSVYIFVLFLSMCVVISLLVLLLRLVFIPKARGQKIIHQLVYFVSRMVLKLVPIGVTKQSEADAFKAPELVICNHQSHLDILVLLSLSPKLVLLTKDWVWKNPFYGFFIRYLEFYPASRGLDVLKKTLGAKVDQGYSLVVFPEGTRSEMREVQRFKQGAFELAHVLNLPIRPILIHGLGEMMPKHEILIKKANIFIKILPLIDLTSGLWGTERRQQAKAIRRFYVDQMSYYHQQWMKPGYFHKKVAESYLYHWPETYWYVRRKLCMESNYRVIDRLIPADASITDLGCGYGYVSLMLYLRSPRRKIKAVDIDGEKIALAQHLFYAQFIDYQCCKLNQWCFDFQDVFMINDVLHYLDPKEQQELLLQCAEHLNPEGLVIVRESDAANEKHAIVHKNEEVGRKYMKFNQLQGEHFHFINTSILQDLGRKAGLKVHQILSMPNTSNTIYVLRK